MPVLPFSLLLLAAGASALATPQGGALVCDLVLAEERLERDDLDLNVQITLSERDAAGRIYDLVEALWKSEAIEQIVFLRAKHDRDATRIDHERARHALERQEASIEQIGALCETSGDSAKPDAARRKAEKAFERYRLAACEVLADDERRAAADLSFSEALLESVRDLRANNVAAEQDVILALRDVEKASKRLEQAHRRVEACREETKGLRPPIEPAHLRLLGAHGKAAQKQMAAERSYRHTSLRQRGSTSRRAHVPLVQSASLSQPREGSSRQNCRESQAFWSLPQAWVEPVSQNSPRWPVLLQRPLNASDRTSPGVPTFSMSLMMG